MKIIFALLCVVFYVLPTAAWSSTQRLIDLKEPTVVRSGIVSLEAPKGWSFLLSKYDDPVDLLKVPGIESKSSISIELSPGSSPGNGPISLAISDNIPRVPMTAEQTAKLRSPPLEVKTENWGGRPWAEEESVEILNSVGTTHIFATTHLATRDLAMSAWIPTEKVEIYRPIIAKIMQSMSIQEGMTNAQ